MRRFSPCLLLGLLALPQPLAAQSNGFSAGGAVILGLDSLKKATNNTLGFTVAADYDSLIWNTDIPARLGLTYADLPGKENFGLKTSLTLLQFHGDLFLDTDLPALRGILGISFNRYGMTTSGTEDTADPMDVDHHFPIRQAKGLKLGARVGLAYRFSKAVSGELLLQQTELAGKDLEDPLVRQGGINPAWFQLGVTYHF